MKAITVILLGFFIAAALTSGLPQQAQQSMNWQVIQDVDEMTSEVRTIAEAYDGDAALSAQCLSGRPVILLMVQEIIGDARLSRARQPAFRVDENSPSTFSWTPRQRGGSLMDDEARSFVDAVKSGSSIRTRIVTFESRSIDNTFTLVGANEALAVALQNCP